MILKDVKMYTKFNHGYEIFKLLMIDTITKYNI